MGILEQLKPNAVFHYFEEICNIPHGSSNTKEISDYCVGFAKQHGLRYIQDESNNVIIFKDGTAGYEDLEPVLIQGHLDMVCEKEPDCDIDFEKEGLRLAVRKESVGEGSNEETYVYAEGTTLGADDGIAVAFALAILASDDIMHPPIEAVFTVDEEIGMLGAAAIDCQELKGKMMLNLDSEEEGFLLVSCAGGVTATCHIPVERIRVQQNMQTAQIIQGRLLVTGLQGGHSGVEIDKGRANANQILGRVLFALKEEMDFEIICVNGGLKDNAIPREAYADIVITESISQNVQQFLKRYNEILANEYRATDANIHLKWCKETKNGIKATGETVLKQDDESEIKVFDKKSKDAVIAALVNLPGGIQKMSRDVEGLVQTSLNLGILKTDEQEVTMSFSVRSSVKTEKEELVLRLKCLMEALGGTVTCVGEYPAWEYKKDSKLRDLMIQVYEELYGEGMNHLQSLYGEDVAAGAKRIGKKPVIQAIHAGVECGLFAGKIAELDCVSFGPNIYDIHTPKERLEVSSVQRTWEYVLEILKRLK